MACAEELLIVITDRCCPLVAFLFTFLTIFFVRLAMICSEIYELAV